MMKITNRIMGLLIIPVFFLTGCGSLAEFSRTDDFHLSPKTIEYANGMNKIEKPALLGLSSLGKYTAAEYNGVTFLWQYSLGKSNSGYGFSDAYWILPLLYGSENEYSYDYEGNAINMRTTRGFFIFGNRHVYYRNEGNNWKEMAVRTNLLRIPFTFIGWGTNYFKFFFITFKDESFKI